MTSKISLIFVVVIASVFYGKTTSLEDFSFNESNRLNVITTENNAKTLENRVEFTELSAERNVKVSMVYIAGKRFAGDRLVGQTSKNQSWAVPQNVTVSISYPARGLGATVTFASVAVEQSSNLGRAYVTKGGIHQRFITVVVEAYHTNYFNYIAKVYGI